MVQTAKEDGVLWGGWSTLSQTSGIHMVNLKPKDSRWAELGATLAGHPNLHPHATTITKT
jgi:hypothetical protein